MQYYILPYISSTVRVVQRLATDWTTGVPGVRLPARDGNFSSPPRPAWIWGPPSPLSNGYLVFFPGGKAAGAWSWPLAFFKYRSQRMRGAIPPPHYVFMAWYLVTHRDSFTLYPQE